MTIISYMSFTKSSNLDKSSNFLLDKRSGNWWGLKCSLTRIYDSVTSLRTFFRLSTCFWLNKILSDFHCSLLFWFLKFESFILFIFFCMSYRQCLESLSMCLAKNFTIVLNATPDWKQSLGTHWFYFYFNWSNLILFSYSLVHYVDQNTVNACACNKVLFGENDNRIMIQTKNT